MPHLDPEAQALIDSSVAAIDFAEQATEESIIAARGAFAAITAPRVHHPAAEIAGTHDVDIAVVGGTIAARLYTPLGDGPFPIHVYYHGGAFVFGSAFEDRVDATARDRAAEAGVVVVNVEYRLAPEHRFPTGVEDAYAALVWAHDHAAEFNGNPLRISVGGVSSGGNFAAAVAVMSRDRGGPALVLQLPEIAGADITKSSYSWRNRSFGHDVTRKADLKLIDYYVRTPADKVHPYASPLMAPDLSGAAPAYVMSAEFDPRRDECEAYVARLQDAGVEAVARTMDGHVHGSMMLVDTWEPARRWASEANLVIRHANTRTAGVPLDSF